MKQKHSLYRLVLVIALSASCSDGDTQKSQSETVETKTESDRLTLSKESAMNADVGVENAGPAVLLKTLTIQGEVNAIPERLAAIVARLEGLVTKVSANEGDKVIKGQAMVTIKSKKLAEAKLTYLEAEHRLHFAKDALERESKLVQNRISSEEMYQKVVHQKKAAEIEHAAALQRLRLLGFSEAWLHKLSHNPDQELTSYTLRAPFQGEVISKNVTMGEAVMEDETLFKLADLSELFVEVKVPIESLPLFHKDARVDVQCDVLDLKAEGVVAFIASMAEAETRTVTVKIRIANPNGQWRPGMPARVELKNSKLEVKLAIPLSAIHEINGQSIVFVKTGERTYRPTRVVLGDKDNRVQEIKAGLKSQDPVAVKNSLALKAEWLKRKGD